MDLSIASKRSVGGRIASNAGVLFVAKAAGALIGLVALITAARYLDRAEFGIVVLLHGYMLFFGEMMTFQPWQTIIRFGSDDVEAGDGASLAKLIKFAVKLDAVSVVLSYLAAVTLFGVFLAAMQAFPDLVDDALPLPPDELYQLAVFYCSVVLFQQIGMSTGVLRLFDRFNGLAAAWMVMPLVRLVGVLIAANQGWGVVGYVVVWYVASLLRYLTVIGLGVYELHARGLLKPVIRAKVSFLGPRDGVWAFSTKAFTDSSLGAGFTHLPLLLVSAVFGPAIGAVFKVAEEVAKLLSEGVKLLDQVIYPELARIIAAGEGRQILRLVTRASLLSIAVGLALAALVYVFGPGAIDRSIGEEYAMTVDLAVLLVLGAAVFAAVAPLYPVFYAVGRPERAIYARLGGIIAYIASFFVLTAWLGPMGIGWASIVGYAVALVLVVALVSRTLAAFSDEAEPE